MAVYPRVVALIVCALLLWGCAQPSTGTGDITTYTDPKTSIEVTGGESFRIVLKSNVTTGYEWGLTEPLDERLVTLVDSEYEGPGSGAVGAGGEEIWTVKAVDPGETRIVLDYAFAGNGQREEPVKTRTFEVAVR